MRGKEDGGTKRTSGAFFAPTWVLGGKGSKRRGGKLKGRLFVPSNFGNFFFCFATVTTPLISLPPPLPTQLTLKTFKRDFALVRKFCLARNELQALLWLCFRPKVEIPVTNENRITVL